MPTVPITPTRPLRVAATSARTPGSITPMTGTGSDSVNVSRAAAAAVLHATTTIFTSKSVDQRVGDLVREVPDLGERTGPVRVAPGVADVDEVLVGQQVDHGPGNGEPAEPAVEHADRAVVGHVARLRAPLVLWRVRVSDTRFRQKFESVRSR